MPHLDLVIVLRVPWGRVHEPASMLVGCVPLENRFTNSLQCTVLCPKEYLKIFYRKKQRKS
jgi:hypothetical protein